MPALMPSSAIRCSGTLLTQICLSVLIWKVEMIICPFSDSWHRHSRRVPSLNSRDESQHYFFTAMWNKPKGKLEAEGICCLSGAHNLIKETKLEEKINNNIVQKMVSVVGISHCRRCEICVHWAKGSRCYKGPRTFV